MPHTTLVPPNDDPTFQEESFDINIPIRVVDLNNASHDSLVYIGDTELEDFKTLNELKDAINQQVINNR